MILLKRQPKDCLLKLRKRNNMKTKKDKKRDDSKREHKERKYKF
jgi:hypothetical protein